MRLRCLRRDAEAAGDLPGGRAAGDQGEYLDLTRGEPGRPGPPLPPLLADGGKHGIHRIALQVTRPDLPPQFVGSLLVRQGWPVRDRKSTRLNSSHVEISYAVFCLKKKKNT